MKILTIRLTNLNSLRGEHFLDLTAEPLVSAGIFAITGSTGAGKTTILDAITLALYGRAARYGKDNPENIMTRHCGECSAEVEFEVPAGKFRALYQRRRARGKADGKLQAATRFLYDVDGQVLAQQVRPAEEKIEQLVGLNYERFLRSALLAQGDFAKFLEANPNDRAGLLESLTGTVIYSRLGQLAHEEANLREGGLAKREAEIEAFDILPKKSRKKLKKRSRRVARNWKSSKRNSVRAPRCCRRLPLLAMLGARN